MKLFDTLAKYQKNINLKKSEEYYFYINNRFLLSNIERYKYLLDIKNEFDIIRANIIIHAIKNKNVLDKTIIYAYEASNMKTEDVIDFVHEQMVGKPYLVDGDNKIYIPIFSRAINSLYYDQFGKLLKDPYNQLLDNFDSSCIDLFELYNFNLYNSLFTKLVTIYRDDHYLIAYHFDFHTIYIINDQGRLDSKIALFDKYLKRPNYSHIIERIKPAIEKYLQDDKRGMLEELRINKLISDKLIMKIKHRDIKIKTELESKIKWDSNW